MVSGVICLLADTHIHTKLILSSFPNGQNSPFACSTDQIKDFDKDSKWHRQTNNSESAHDCWLQTPETCWKIISWGQGCCQMISEGRGGWPSGIMPRKSRALALMRPANRQQNPTISHPPWLSHRNIEVRRWEIHSVRWDKYGWPNLGNTVWGPVNLGPAH